MYSLNRSSKSVDRPALVAPRLLGQVRERIRYLHYSLRTEEAYVYWVKAFVRWSGLRHPRDMGGPQVEEFLSMLANERRVAPATHRQALSALLFLYREVFCVDMPWLQEIGRPPQRKRIPSVLTRAEVAQLLALVAPESGCQLLLQLLYGTGLRLAEGLALRIKDVDFDRRVIVVREGKNAKDRVVMLPHSIEAALRAQCVASRATWSDDRLQGRSGVELPYALEAKYPRAGLSWSWFWLFPAASLLPG